MHSAYVEPSRVSPARLSRGSAMGDEPRSQTGNRPRRVETEIQSPSTRRVPGKSGTNPVSSSRPAGGNPRRRSRTEIQSPSARRLGNPSTHPVLRPHPAKGQMEIQSPPKRWTLHRSNSVSTIKWRLLGMLALSFSLLISSAQADYKVDQCQIMYLEGVPVFPLQWSYESWKASETKRREWSEVATAGFKTLEDYARSCIAQHDFNNSEEVRQNPRKKRFGFVMQEPRGRFCLNIHSTRCISLGTRVTVDEAYGNAKFKGQTGVVTDTWKQGQHGNRDCATVIFAELSGFKLSCEQKYLVPVPLRLDLQRSKDGLPDVLRNKCSDINQSFVGTNFEVFPEPKRLRMTFENPNNKEISLRICLGCTDTHWSIETIHIATGESGGLIYDKKHKCWPAVEPMELTSHAFVKNLRMILTMCKHTNAAKLLFETSESDIQKCTYKTI